MTNEKYKEFLINNIIMFQTENQFTKEELKNKSIHVLEVIHDNVK